MSETFAATINAREYPPSSGTLCEIHVPHRTGPLIDALGPAAARRICMRQSSACVNVSPTFACITRSAYGSKSVSVKLMRAVRRDACRATLGKVATGSTVNEVPRISNKSQDKTPRSAVSI